MQLSKIKEFTPGMGFKNLNIFKQFLNKYPESLDPDFSFSEIENENLLEFLLLNFSMINNKNLANILDFLVQQNNNFIIHSNNLFQKAIIMHDPGELWEVTKFLNNHSYDFENDPGVFSLISNMQMVDEEQLSNSIDNYGKIYKKITDFILKNFKSKDNLQKILKKIEEKDLVDSLKENQIYHLIESKLIELEMLEQVNIPSDKKNQKI